MLIEIVWEGRERESKRYDKFPPKCRDTTFSTLRERGGSIGSLISF
jgi:hypothetical protein